MPAAIMEVDVQLARRNPRLLRHLSKRSFPVAALEQVAAIAGQDVKQLLGFD
jgi:hypothetical protein